LRYVGFCRVCEVATGRFVAFKSQNQGLAERRLWRNLTGRFGHGHDDHLSEFIAEKRPLKFRFPEAAIGR
jgi:hypothetical protein